jgi:hypothetical protein
MGLAVHTPTKFAVVCITMSCVGFYGLSTIWVNAMCLGLTMTQMLGFIKGRRQEGSIESQNPSAVL